jgi:hypothetical protein
MSKEELDSAAESEVAPRTATAVVPIGDGWNAEFSPQPRGALLRVGRGAGERTLEIHISLTAEGPVIRAHAAALEIDSDTDLVARCERFRVEARESVDIVSAGTVRAQGRRVDVEATHGTARIRANDDVQLLGENVLLNCERQPPMPEWALPVPFVPGPSLPVEEVSGDAELLQAVKGER